LTRQGSILSDAQQIRSMSPLIGML
jgi:hypothetical protein